MTDVLVIDSGDAIDSKLPPPIRRIGRLGSINTMSAILAVMAPAFGDMHMSQMMGTPWEAPVCYYDPEEVPKRGGRWRACSRWRRWWAKRQRPATRYTSRGSW